MNKLKILIVGGGKMGFALMQGFIASGVKEKNITVIEPKPADKLSQAGVNILSDASDVGEDFDFCIFAVKPQNFDEVVKSYNFLNNGKCVFLSIAAGKTISKMEKLLGDGALIARAMPNLPATVSAGITAVCFNKAVSSAQKDQVLKLLKAVGEVVEISDEAQIDLVTAISGSGPAYAFHMMEAMYNTGVKMGLEKDAAMKLAKYTIYGAGKLAVESETTPENLRCDVTSPGGTTEAALKVLMEDKKLEKLMENAIKAAKERSKELAA